MGWSWQEPYDAALLEKNPDNLPERLVTAEKAILRRIQEICDSTGELPEAQALREALDSLYALRPREHYPPGELTDETDDAGRGDWTRLAATVALVLFLSLAAWWLIARGNGESEDGRREAFRDTSALVHSRTATVIEPEDKSAPDALPREYASATNAPRGSPARQLRYGKADPRPVSKSNAVKESENAGDLTRATAGELDSAAPATPVPPLAIAPSPEVAKHAPRSANANATAEPAERSEAAPSPGNETREQPPLPEGSVSVSSSTYPSIRIPPELSSEAALSAASLQIGTPVSRPSPVYPEEAARRGVQGTAKLRVVIGKDGSVQEVQVISGPPLLTSASASALRQWRYKPTFLGDKPVEVSQEITIEFRLSQAQPPQRTEHAPVAPANAAHFAVALN